MCDNWHPAEVLSVCALPYLKKLLDKSSFQINSSIEVGAVLKTHAALSFQALSHSMSSAVRHRQTRLSRAQPYAGVQLSQSKVKQPIIAIIMAMMDCLTPAISSALTKLKH